MNPYPGLLFSNHFRPLLKWVVFFEVVSKISSCQKSYHQIKLNMSKSMMQTVRKLSNTFSFSYCYQSWNASFRVSEWPVALSPSCYNSSVFSWTKLKIWKSSQTSFRRRTVEPIWAGLFVCFEFIHAETTKELNINAEVVTFEAV